MHVGEVSSLVFCLSQFLCLSLSGLLKVSLSPYLKKKKGITITTHQVFHTALTDTLDIRHRINTHIASLICSFTAHGRTVCDFTIVTHCYAPSVGEQLSMMAECGSSAIRWLELKFQVSHLKSYFFPSKSVYLDNYHLTHGKKDDRECLSKRIPPCTWSYTEKLSFFLFLSPQSSWKLSQSHTLHIPKHSTSLNPSTQRCTLALIHSLHVQDEEGNFM